MRKLCLFATLLLAALGLQAQTNAGSVAIPPQQCFSAGQLSHCGLYDENHTFIQLETNSYGSFILYGHTYDLPAVNPEATDLTAGEDANPILYTQFQSDTQGNTVSVILHGYYVKHKTSGRGSHTVTLPYITSGTITVTATQ
jgi:hypothetical protein